MKPWDRLAEELADTLEAARLRRNPAYQRVRDTIRHTSQDIDPDLHALNIHRAAHPDPQDFFAAGTEEP